MAISKGAAKEMLNKYSLHICIYITFDIDTFAFHGIFYRYNFFHSSCIQQSKSNSIMERIQSLQQKKSFQSLYNAKGLFNNMQKLNRLVTGALPYLQPHVQGCGFTKKSFQTLGIV